MTNLRDEKILITGPAGQIAFPLAAGLAENNEVWGIARLRELASQLDPQALRALRKSFSPQGARLFAVLLSADHG